MTIDIAAWQHSVIHEAPELFPEDMKTANHIIRATLRQTAPASCFMQGTDGRVRKDWPLSGRTTE